MANYCVTIASTEESRELVYSIEDSFYGWRHPLTYDEHQKLTKEHKRLLEKYRKNTRDEFLKLDSQTLDANDIFAESNIVKAKKFGDYVFKKSKDCSDGLLNISKSIIESCVENLEHANISAPCKFAVIGLGSIATGVATPYSDLEFGFIIEQESQYFEKLAVESYFRIGNLGETSLKHFNIDELKGDQVLCNRNFKVGFRIDGITSKAGNIPTGNGIDVTKTLTLTVDGFMQLYKEAAEEKFSGIAGDKSDMLSSSVLIYTNEQSSSQLYELFSKKRANYERNKGANSRVVEKKRYDSFVLDINSFSFLPEFTNFRPSQNLSIQVKTDIFRYPTLLANNIKMCLGLETQYPWDTFHRLYEEKTLSYENYRYICIVLALSIYIRTSAYTLINNPKQSQLL